MHVLIFAINATVIVAEVNCLKLCHLQLDSWVLQLASWCFQLAAEIVHFQLAAEIVQLPFSTGNCDGSTAIFNWQLRLFS